MIVDTVNASKRKSELVAPTAPTEKKLKKRKATTKKLIAVDSTAPLVGPAEAGTLELPPADDPGNSSKSSLKDGGTFKAH